MADLLFGDFAVMAGQAMEEEQFRLPDYFSKAYFTFLSSLCDPASGFAAVFRVLLIPGTGNGERGTGVWERVYSGAVILMRIQNSGRKHGNRVNM